MIKKFNSFINEAQYDRTATEQDNKIENDIITYSKEFLDYLNGSIEDISNSIYDCENGAISEDELKDRMNHILGDNIGEEVENYLWDNFGGK